MLEFSFLLFVCGLFCFLSFSQYSDRCLVSILGERGAVQASVCFQESVWETLFLQNAALVIIGIQYISQSGMRESQSWSEHLGTYTEF